MTDSKTKTLVDILLRNKRLLSFCALILLTVSSFCLIISYSVQNSFEKFYHPLFTNDLDAYILLPSQKAQIIQTLNLLEGILAREHELLTAYESLAHLQAEESGIMIRGGEVSWFFKNPSNQDFETKLDSFEIRLAKDHFLIFGSKRKSAGTSVQAEEKKKLALLKKKFTDETALFVYRPKQKGAFFYGAFFQQEGRKFQLALSPEQLPFSLGSINQNDGKVAITVTEGAFPLSGLFAHQEAADHRFLSALWPGEFTLEAGTLSEFLQNPYAAELSWQWKGAASRKDLIQDAALTDLAHRYPSLKEHILPDGIEIQELQRSKAPFLSEAEEQSIITYPQGQMILERKKEEVFLRKGDAPSKAVENTCIIENPLAYGSVQKGLNQIESFTFSYSISQIALCFEG